MDSLASYTSDGEESNNSDDIKMPYPERRDEIPTRRASDANYDPVQMDMSEESNNNNSSGESGSERANSPPIGHFQRGSRHEAGRSYSSSSDQRRSNHETNTSKNSRDDQKKEKLDRPRHSEDRYRADEKSRRSSHDDRRRESDHRDGKDAKKSREAERRAREDERRKERSTSRSNKEERGEDKEKGDKDHHHRDERRDRERRRDRDRDRRHPREERAKDRHRGEDRSSHQKEKERIRSRSRSRSKDHGVPPFRTMSYREEKSRNKLAQLEKLGIELKAPEVDNNTAANVQGEQNFYNPLATATQGKYAEQIQKRKLLWANKSKTEEGKQTSSAAGTANTWVGTTFTHDQDGKVTAKFKRLMGIKGDLPVAAPAQGAAKPEILKKQEEMFSNMEQQYEVARATTHTQRGVGFGYATGGYQFPR